MYRVFFTILKLNDYNFVVIELPICIISQAQFEACLTICSLKKVKRWLPGR
jgi:hypothetical protein